jgi:hypothetical protein
VRGAWGSLPLAPCSLLSYPQSKGQSFPIPIPSNRPKILVRHGSNRFIFPEDISIVSPNGIADFTKSEGGGQEEIAKME